MRVLTYEELLQALQELDVPPGFRAELLHGEIVLSSQGGEEHSEIILAGQVAALAAGLPRWRATSDVLSPFPEHRHGFCPDVAILRAGATRGENPRLPADIAAVIEVVSGDLGANDYGIKVLEYAAAGIEAYLIADPRLGRCTLYTGPVGGRYGEPEVFAFGAVVRFTADGTEFVLDTGDWPRTG